MEKEFTCRMMNHAWNLTATDTNFEICTLHYSKHQSVIHSPSDGFFVNQILVCLDSLVNGVLIPLTIFFNGVAIVTISKCPQLKEKLCYFLVLVQSVTDLLVAVIGLPVFMLVLVGDIKGDANCAVNSVLIHAPHLTAGYSLITLSFISFERYMGVLHPFIHRTKITKKKLLFHVFHSCVSHTVTVLIFYVYMTVRRLVIATVIPVFLVGTTYIYVRIFLVARKRLMATQNPNAIAGQGNKSAMDKKKTYLREIKLAKSCFMIVLLFIFSFLPLSIVYVFFADQMTPTTFRIVQSWCLTLATLNSSLNSVIFFWTRAVLKKEAKKIFGKICAQPSI